MKYTPCFFIISYAMRLKVVIDIRKDGKKRKNILYITATIVATVIGAGFATGQEIYTFFCAYGKLSVIGLLAVFFLFWFSFEFILKRCFYEKTENISQFLNMIPNRRIRAAAMLCITLFSFCGFCAMASATGALISEGLGCGEVWGTVGMILLCCWILSGGIGMISNVNLILAPLICIGLVWLSVSGMLHRSVEAFAGQHYYTDAGQIILSAVLYVSYNILSVVAVLCSMRKYCDSLRTVRLSSMLGAGALVVVAGAVWLVMMIYANKITLGELPLLTIAKRNAAYVAVLYGFLLLAGIFTTAIGCGHASVMFLRAKTDFSLRKSAFTVALAALPVSLLGFSEIVRVFYTFFGYLGLPFLLFMAILHVKNNRKGKNKSKKYGN